MNTSPNIRTLRKSLGWSQAQMAEYLGLDRSSVSRMEGGQEPKGPTIKLLQHLDAAHPVSTPAEDMAERRADTAPGDAA